MNAFLKRALDIVLSAIGLAILMPFLVAIAVAIKLDTPGPVFYRQERVGRHGRTFRIFKFRSMTWQPADDGRQLTVAGDSRITRVGAVLRHYKLDELPQLIDVLRGTMSLVGPRPEVSRYVRHYPPEVRETVLKVRPGITDFASLKYRHENELLARAADPEREYIDAILPAKLRYAADYAQNPTLADDLRVLGLTLQTIFLPPLSAEGVFRMKDRRLWVWLDEAMSGLQAWRRVFTLLADAAIIVAAWHLAYLFRLGVERWQPGRPQYDDLVLMGVVVVYLFTLVASGAQRTPWRFAGFDDFRRMVVACVLAGLASAAGVLMAQLSGVARAVLVLHPIFSAAGLVSARMWYRMVWEHAHSRATLGEADSRRAIVMGAGEAARRLVAGIHRRDGWVVLGLLDDDPAKRGRRVGGVPVLGTLKDLRKLHIGSGATHVILAMPRATPEQRQQALVIAQDTGLPVLTVPSESELQVHSGESR